MDAVLHRELQQVDDVAVIGDGNGLFRPGRIIRHLEGLPAAFGHQGHPPLGPPGLDARGVHLGDDAHAPRDLHGLRLGSAHSPQARRHEEDPGQVVPGADPQPLPRGVEERVERPVDDPLGTDVHPAAGGHLAVVAHAELHRPVPFRLVVEDPHEEPVGEDHPGGLRPGPEEPEGVAALDDEGHVLGQLLEVFLEEPVLEPVLAHLAGFPVGDQLVGVKGDLEVQVVVDHDLESLPRQALALVVRDGPAPDAPLGPEAVGVDPAAGPQLLHELGGEFRVHRLRDVAKGVLQRQFRLGLPQGPAPVRGAPDPLPEGRVLRQPRIQPDAHRTFDLRVLVHGQATSHVSLPSSSRSGVPVPCRSPPSRRPK